MEKFVIVGTAGHIDHGKTALVTALTGKDTDRLKEEKERGISIDIDFAPLKYDDGTIIGIVDVPGHEKFIKNMVAGAAGINIALLVIDINEGMKPQTYEHIDIIQMLGIKQGIVVLTKIDLADEEFIEISREIIKEELVGTIFEQSPIVLTSSTSGFGLDVLKETIRKLADKQIQKNVDGHFRLPVDKIFSIKGFGTVVSGTIWSGSVSVGDIIECLPSSQKIKVRNIQVHGKNVDEAFTGQRAALNISGIDKEEIKRGYNLCSINSLNQTKLLNVYIESLKEIIKHRQNIHFHLGTAEIYGKILLLEENETNKPCYAQLLLQKPIVCSREDKFVIRGNSPLTTLGGGKVINPTPNKLYRRHKSEIIEMLKLDGNSREKDNIEVKFDDLLKQVKEAHRKYRLSSYVSRSLFDKKLVSMAIDNGFLETNGPGVRLRNWEVQLSLQENEMLEAIIRKIHSNLFDGSSLEDICNDFPKQDRIAKSLVFYAVEKGVLVDISQNKFICSQDLDFALRQISDLSDSFTLGEVRDILKIGRKSALALLEYFDDKRITKRIGDSRILVKTNM